MGAWLHGVGALFPLEVRGEQIGARAEVATCPASENGAHQFHVLARHRPPSIPPLARVVHSPQRPLDRLVVAMAERHALLLVRAAVLEPDPAL